MSPRKRRLNSSPTTQHQNSKRIRLITNLADSQASAASTYSSKSSGDSVYTVRAIIGEKPGEYLIDWAENKFTGESYSPDWKNQCAASMQLSRS
ncbi:MAG: hypothetical protein Q9183_001733 [Haloplaca sp. 2 TL-2023]